MTLVGPLCVSAQLLPCQDVFHGNDPRNTQLVSFMQSRQRFVAQTVRKRKSFDGYLPRYVSQPLQMTLTNLLVSQPQAELPAFTTTVASGSNDFGWIGCDSQLLSWRENGTQNPG